MPYTPEQLAAIRERLRLCFVCQAEPVGDTQRCAEHMGHHRWSGWPGASCMDCFAEDADEACIAEHDVQLRCTCHGEYMPFIVESHVMQTCSEHVNGPCENPGRFWRTTGM